MPYSIYCEDLKIAQKSGSFLQLNYLLEYDSTILITVLHILLSFFKTNLLEHSCFAMLCQFLPRSKVNQLYICMYMDIHIHIYPFFGGFLPIQVTAEHGIRFPVLYQVPISYLFYTQQYIYVDPNLPTHHTLLPTWHPYVGSLHLCLYFCFEDKFICTTFLDQTINNSHL